jgi:hypothetical protein
MPHVNPQDTRQFQDDDGVVWTVTPVANVSPSSGHYLPSSRTERGLRFTSANDVQRFLAQGFDLPSREQLKAMSEEVLRELLSLAH